MAVEMSAAQMLNLHLSFVTVSVAVAAGADNHILLPCFEVAKKSFSSNPSTSDTR